MTGDSGRSSRLIGGIALILLGLLYIVTNTINAAWEIWLWIVFFGAAAVGLGWVYRQSQEGWAAIVGYVAGALAVLLFVVEVINPAGQFVPVMVLLLIAIPFVFAWNRSRQQWGLLVPAYVMVAIIPVLFLGDGASADRLVPAYVLAVIGLPFVVVYLVQRRWPILIPAVVMFALAAFFLLDAMETAGPLVNGVAALAMIGGGLYLLLRPGGDNGLKSKREN